MRMRASATVLCAAVLAAFPLLAPAQTQAGGAGDLALLDAPAPYDNKVGSETPLYEHLQRCMRYTLDRLGPHRLPLIGRADWNDCLNLNCFSTTPDESFQTTENKTEGSKAESLMIAGLFVMPEGPTYVRL